MNIRNDVKLIRELANVKNVSVENAAENTGYLIENSDAVLLSFTSNPDYPVEEKQRILIELEKHSVPDFFNNTLWDRMVITNIATGEPTPWTVFVKNIIDYLKHLP